MFFRRRLLQIGPAECECGELRADMDLAVLAASLMQIVGDTIAFAA